MPFEGEGRLYSWLPPRVSRRVSVQHDLAHPAGLRNPGLSPHPAPPVCRERLGRAGHNLERPMWLLCATRASHRALSAVDESTHGREMLL